MSEIGYGAIMGLLRNYEVVNPFVSSSYNSLQRLKPGFEAPVCIVTSLGFTKEVPSRNRTVLAGLVRDDNNPMATRFELRSPNPHSNIYLVITVTYMAMLDGIMYALENNKTEEELLAELSKKAGETADYLETNRAYRSEEDVFEDFTEEERNTYFGKAPATVYENLIQLENNPEKLNVLKRNDVLTDSLINSFKLAVTQRWATEISHRVISNYTAEIRSFKKLHCTDALDLDVSNWMKINALRHEAMKDTYTNQSLFTRIKIALGEDDFKTASYLALELDEKMNELRDLYSNYKKNLLDI